MVKMSRLVVWSYVEKGKVTLLEDIERLILTAENNGEKYRYNGWYI